MVPAEMAMFAEVVADKPVVSAITDLCALSPGTGLGVAKPFNVRGSNTEAAVGSSVAWAHGPIPLQKVQRTVQDAVGCKRFQPELLPAQS